MVTIEQTHDSDYTIFADEEPIGTIRMFDETGIAFVEIDSSRQGNGYGPRALRELIDHLKATKSGTIYVSTPVHESLETVLTDYGFVQNEDGNWMLPQ